MPRKQTLSALLERRKRLDEEIESMRKEELAAVARWVLKKTNCSSLAELKAAGWMLTKQPPADGAAEGDEDAEKDENGAGETEIKAFNPSSVWNG